MDIKLTPYDIKDRFEEIYTKAAKECNTLERFPGYFNYKKFETLLILDKSGIKGKEPVLEIGCGTGFQSSLLANCCNRVISTDLPDFSKKEHTIGIKKAKEMSARLDIRNIEHVGCSAVNLPFKDKSFGCVISSSVLEHVGDKVSALKEMKRVLKDDGIVICSVPTYMESVFQFPALYLYMVKRFYDVIRNKLFKKKVKSQSIFFNNDNKDSSRRIGELIKTFFRNNPSFPFPEPHGDWRNKQGKQSIFVEFYEQLPWKWHNMFLNSGLRITNSFAILFIPYRIIEIFSPRLLTKIYCSTQFLHRNLADSFLKYLSITICYVARRKR